MLHNNQHFLGREAISAALPAPGSRTFGFSCSSNHGSVDSQIDLAGRHRVIHIDYAPTLQPVAKYFRSRYHCVRCFRQVAIANGKWQYRRPRPNRARFVRSAPRPAHASTARGWLRLTEARFQSTAPFHSMRAAAMVIISSACVTSASFVLRCPLILPQGHQDMIFWRLLPLSIIASTPSTDDPILPLCRLKE